MKRTKHLAWSSDTHFNLTTQRKILAFCDEIARSGAEALVLTGDLAESDCVVKHLKDISAKLGSDFPIYFILGNHDYYRTNTKELHRVIRKDLKGHPTLYWLTENPCVPLNDTTALVGSENWWDGRAGNLSDGGILDTIAMIPDYTLIDDFAWMRKGRRFQVIRKLADQCTKRILKKLRRAFKRFETIYLAVHVPPFREVCLNDGKKMAPNWLLHFCHHDLGEKLVKLMQEMPTKELIVLAGHTHQEASLKILDNLQVMVARANYFNPKLSKVLKIT